MKKLTTILTAAAVAAISGTANASVIFSFDQVGADVLMTSSGTLDTNKMQLFGTDGWGGTGIEQNANGQTDIMGDTSFGRNDITFTFSVGTDQSAWLNPGGPWGSDSFDWTVTGGSKSFATFGYDNSFIRNAGMSMGASDIVNGLWTPDQSWINTNDTFASLNMSQRTYTVADAVTGESITIQVGGVSVVPVPASLPLLLGALGGIVLLRRRKKT